MRLTNKSVKWWEFTVVLVFFISLFGSCKYELVREPTLIYDESKNAADYEDYILPPKEVRASQGQKKSVTLSWEPVENAVQYQIYSAATPYDPFAKISETKAAETEIIIDEESGITKYYSVCAVNYYGTVSAKSVVVMGSTLAVPVITEITADSEGDAVFLEWWMDNCSEQTYQNSVAFNVYASLKSSPNIKVRNLTVAGNVRNLKIDGLTSKTEYLFEVEVLNSLAGVKETSGKCSAETAHRVLPDAPLDFSVTKGIDKNEVVLNWKTPDGAWYRQNSGASGFVKHPLYFEIYKKESGKEGEYTRLALIKLGADTSASQTELVFSDEDKANCSKLDAPYDNYYIGASLSYTDTITDENRGKKYSYYVQSITDDVPAGKIITSQSSCTPVEEGWTVGVPVFSIKTDYQQTGTEDQARFTQITFEYNLKFDNYGIGYTYFVKRQQLALTGGTPVGEPQWVAYNSVESINAKKDIFNPVQGQTENEYGYYIYTLYLCQAGTTEAECKNNQFYYEAPASGRYIVTHDASNIPKIGSFTVDDGYADKYKLKWEYNSEYVYTIHWWKMHGDEKGTEESLEIAINNANITTEGGKEYYNYTHQGITSGDRRIYQLEASTGLSSYAKYSNNPL